MIEILRAVREAVAPGTPVGIKLNSADHYSVQMRRTAAGKERADAPPRPVTSGALLQTVHVHGWTIW